MPIPESLKRRQVLVVGPMKGVAVGGMKPTRGIKRAQRRIAAQRELIRRQNLLSSSTQVGTQKVRIPWNIVSGVFGPSMRIVTLQDRALILDMRGKPINVNKVAFDKTTSTRTQLRGRAAAFSSKVMDQRRALRRNLEINPVVENLVKIKRMFATLATAQGLMKLDKSGFARNYSVLFDALKKASQNNPQLRRLVKEFESDIWVPRNVEVLMQGVSSPQKLGQVVQKTKDRIIVLQPNGRKLIIFKSFEGIKKEARRRAYVVSPILNGLKQERLQNQQIASSSVSNERKEALALSKIYAGARTGYEIMSSNTTRKVYDYYKGEEEEKERKANEERRARVAKEVEGRIAPLNSALSNLVLVESVYSQLAGAKSFQEAANTMVRVSALTQQISESYRTQLRAIPELNELAQMEQIQLTIPESRNEVKDMLRRGKGKFTSSDGKPLKSGKGTIIAYRENGEQYFMPTTVEIMQRVISTKLKILHTAVLALRNKVEAEKARLG